MPRRRTTTTWRTDFVLERSAGAFSLIELLVVIAIIALLLGIVLPSLGQAMSSARGTVCLSRMRQVAIGWQLYADANQDISAPAQPGRYADKARNIYRLSNGMQYRPKWFAVIGDEAGFVAHAEPSIERADEHAIQVDGSEVFLCPEAADWTSSRNFAYGYNYQFLGNTRFTDIDSGGVEPGASDVLVNFPVRSSSIAASGTVLAADSAGTAAGKATNLRTGNRADGTRDLSDAPLHALGGHGYALDPPRLAEAGSDFADPRFRSDEHRSGPDPRHLDRANVSFADGHANSATLAGLGYGVRPNGSVKARGGDTSNAAFSGSLRDELAPGLSNP